MIVVDHLVVGGEVFPKLDVHEDDKAVHVKAEIPGLDEKDLDVTLKENTLTISGEKKEGKRNLKALV